MRPRRILALRGGAGTIGGEDPGGPTTIALASVSPALGDIYGRAPLVLTVDDSTGINEVTINDVACSDVAIVDATHVACKAPALAAGTYDVQCARPSGQSNVLAAAYEAWHPTVDYPAARVFQSDRGTTSTTTETWVRTGLVADLLPTGFVARDGAALLTLASGRILMVGGWAPGQFPPSAYDFSGDVTNAILYSDDDGETWDTLLEHDSTPGTSRFLPGHTAGVLLHEVDGVPYVYWIGSDANAGAGRDGGVWRCLASHCEAGGTPDSWSRISTAAPTTALSLFAVGSLGGNLYVMGGQTDLSDQGTCTADVYRSTDNGVTWSLVTSAPGWTARSGIASPGALPVFDGKLWIVSGGRYDPDGDARTYYNDVWSYDGTTWTEELANGHGQFTGRQYHSVVVFDGKLWIINGYDVANVNNGLAQAIFSADGATWTSTAALGIQWYPTHAQGATVTLDGSQVIMNQGIANESIYRLRAVTGTRLSAWVDQGSGGLTLAQATGSLKPLLAVGVMGAEPGVVLQRAQWMQLATYDRDCASGFYSPFMVVRTMNATYNASTSQPTSTVIGCQGAEAYNQFGLNADRMAYYDASAGPKDIRSTTPINDDAVRLLGAEHSAGSLKFFVGASQDGATNTTVGFNTTYTGWDGIGSSIGGANFASATLGAIVIVKGATDSTFRTKLATWAKKWGSVNS